MKTTWIFLLRQHRAIIQNICIRCQYLGKTILDIDCYSAQFVGVVWSTFETGLTDQCVQLKQQKYLIKEEKKGSNVLAILGHA